MQQRQGKKKKQLILKNGINFSLLVSSHRRLFVFRGTLYQIINGTLYRQASCLFPARCTGVEYFLLKMIDKLPNMDMIINTRDYPQSSKHFEEALPVFSFSKVGSDSQK